MSEPGYASPACYLNEVDASYAGYLTPAELRQALRRILALDLRLAGQADAAGEGSPAADVLQNALARLGETEAPAIEPGESGSAELSVAELRARIADELSGLLPRVRDDSLHAELRSLIERRRA